MSRKAHRVVVPWSFAWLFVFPFPWPSSHQTTWRMMISVFAIQPFSSIFRPWLPPLFLQIPTVRIQKLETKNVIKMSPGWDRDNVVGNRTELSKPDVGIPPSQAAPAIYPFLQECKSEEVGVRKKSRKSSQKSSLRECCVMEAKQSVPLKATAKAPSLIKPTYFYFFLFFLRWH